MEKKSESTRPESPRNTLDEFDEDYVAGTSVKCPYCNSRMIVELDESEYCEHAAFSHLQGEGVTVYRGATDEQKAWLGNAESRNRFDLLCRTFQLKKRNSFTEDGEGKWTVAFTAPRQTDK